MNKKIVQIASSACDRGGLFVYAVADDGTAWALNWADARTAEWEKLPDLPDHIGDKS